MKPEISQSASPSPSHWASALEAPQSPVKDLNSILALVELDLDGEMRFKKACFAGFLSGYFGQMELAQNSGPLALELIFRTEIMLELGTSSLESVTSLLRLWRFTLAVNPQVLRLQSSFRQLVKGEQIGNESGGLRVRQAGLSSVFES